ncbi:hypothetical protein WR25_14005 [Diploscapter pachys]|uniref:Protein kinase domain-containing protein n=1 Tax=Diploscapter pachys TaxID=2018661 RepID=A0A2A2KVE6_9BILA|nr:hypothetical protein WR25_14005 [Diploscapter pachys]
MLCDCSMLSLFYVLLFGNVIRHASSSLDLYISREEMNRTLGVLADIKYVEDGKYDKPTAAYPYRVSDQIDTITFSWVSHAQVHYTMDIISNDPLVLPIANLRREGYVPTKLQEFTIEYRCSGHRSGQSMVELTFNFTIKTGGDFIEEIPVKLKQEKICAFRDARKGPAGVIAPPTESSFSVETVFRAIIIIAVIFLLIIAVGLLFYLKRSPKKGQTNNSHNGGIEDPPVSHFTRRMPMSFRSASRHLSRPFLTSTPAPKGGDSDAPCSSGTSGISSANSMFEYKERPVNMQKALQKLHVVRDEIRLLPSTDIQGNFGEIRMAMMRDLDENPTPFTNKRYTGDGDVDEIEDEIGHQTMVLCKLFRRAVPSSILNRYLTDALMFYDLAGHPNLIKPCCLAYDETGTETTLPIICYRHKGFGVLKHFLRGCKEKGALRAHELLTMCSDVSAAVHYLHRNHLVHRDIATRNCLVSEPQPGRLWVQLCDPSLSSDLYPNHYEALPENDPELRPIRWLAPESIKHRTYTSASDIWSLTMTLWEIWSVGEDPFPEVPLEDLHYSLTERCLIPPQPPNCPDAMQAILITGWQVDPKARPSAAVLHKNLENFSVYLNKYI